MEMQCENGIVCTLSYVQNIFYRLSDSVRNTAERNQFDNNIKYSPKQLSKVMVLGMFFFFVLLIHIDVYCIKFTAAGPSLAAEKHVIQFVYIVYCEQSTI